MNVHRSSFSFLEILLAVTIVGMSASMLLGGYATNLRLLSNAQHVTTGQWLAQNIIEDLYHSRELKVGMERGDYAQTHPGFTWKREIRPGKTPHTYVVHVVVSDDHRGQTRDHEIRSHIFLAPENKRGSKQDDVP